VIFPYILLLCPGLPDVLILGFPALASNNVGNDDNNVEKDDNNTIVSNKNVIVSNCEASKTQTLHGNANDSIGNVHGRRRTYAEVLTAV
jgi:hypothetical protein